MSGNTFGNRLKRAWSAFFNNRDPTMVPAYERGAYISSSRPDLPAITIANQRSIANAVYTRIATDCAQIPLIHARLDDLNRYVETIYDDLYYRLNESANVDQTGRALMQNAVHIMLDVGHVALVPIVCDKNPNDNDSFNIKELRAGTVVEWRPNYVKVKVFNEQLGKEQELYMKKEAVAIVQNPFYSVMNGPNSTLTRLSRKMALLDASDEANASGKLNMIIQLPYSINSPLRQQQAEKRAKLITRQLETNALGIAYADATEKITQLNRPLENNLVQEVKDLTAQFYTQLGITEAIMNGTADESQNLAYMTRIIEPILSSFADEIKRKFISKLGRTRYYNESVVFFREQFKLVSAENLSKFADTFARNAILTSNELRQIIGFPPSEDPSADVLANKNMPYDDQMLPEEGEEPMEEEYMEEPMEE